MSDSVPIACSLVGNEARSRWLEWGVVMGGRLGIVQTPYSLSVRFSADETSSRLTELVAAEKECCGFVDWELEDLGSEILLTVRGDPEGVLAMAESLGILQ